MNKKIKVSDIYIGYESKSVYSEYLEEYEYLEDMVLLEKLEYYFEYNTTEKALVYKNIITGENVCVKPDGEVFNSYHDESFKGYTYHIIDDIVGVNNLIYDFKNDPRPHDSYREYVKKAYNRLTEFLKNKDFVSKEDIESYFGNMCDLYCYLFSIIDEEEFEEELEEYVNPDKKVLDFNEYKKRIKKQE